MKILFGSIVVDARGRLNGHVLKKTAFGHSISKLALPRNDKVWQTNKALQLNTQVFRAWGLLDNNAKNVFTTFAANNLLTNKFGQKVNIGGRNMFTKLTHSLSFPELVIPKIEDLSNAVPFIQVSKVDFDDEAGDLIINVSDIVGIAVIKIYYKWVSNNHSRVQDNGWKRLPNSYVDGVGDLSIKVLELRKQQQYNENKTLFVKLDFVNLFGFGENASIFQTTAI